MNNRYRIAVSDPLVRPGLTIETEVSENYLEAAVSRLMYIVRRINGAPSANVEQPDVIVVE